MPTTCNYLYDETMSLPTFYMTAGDSKSLTIPIYTRRGQQIDVAGMTARLIIADFVGVCEEPLVVKTCAAAAGTTNDFMVFSTKLEPADTVDLFGCYLYQVTAKDIGDDFGIMRGKLYIYRNRDKAAINM